MTSFRGQADWAKMTSPRGKLKAVPCHPTKKVNKAKELTYLSTNIAVTLLVVTFQPTIISIVLAK
jgi:hypothetical protein